MAGPPQRHAGLACPAAGHGPAVGPPQPYRPAFRRARRSAVRAANTECVLTAEPMLRLSQWLPALRYSQSGTRIGTFGLARYANARPGQHVMRTARAAARSHPIRAGGVAAGLGCWYAPGMPHRPDRRCHRLEPAQVAAEPGRVTLPCRSDLLSGCNLELVQPHPQEYSGALPGAQTQGSQRPGCMVRAASRLPAGRLASAAWQLNPAGRWCALAAAPAGLRAEPGCLRT